MDLVVGLLFGAIGTGYLIYGKRQQSPLFLLTGLGLCIYPYFFDSIILIVLIGAVLAAIPVAVEKGLI